MNARTELLTDGVTAAVPFWRLPEGYCAPYPGPLDRPLPMVSKLAALASASARSIGRAVRAALRGAASVRR
jgi:hypothetical protein